MSAMLWTLGLVLLVGAAIAGLVLLRRRGPTRGRPVTPPPPPRASWRGRPAPGEIWWADVPYQDGDGSKIRPPRTGIPAPSTTAGWISGCRTSYGVPPSSAGPAWSIPAPGARSAAPTRPAGSSN
jgi:hypothetical protein